MAHPHNNPTCDKDSLEGLKDSTHSKDKQLSSCSSNNAIVQHLAESNSKTISKDSTNKSNSRKRKPSRPHQIPGTEVTCSHSNLSLRLHLSTHTGENTFNCQICKMEFNRKQHLSSHNWNNHLTPEDKERVKAGSCYFCAKPFQSYSTLQSHLLIHTQEKHFKCSVCKKQFTRKGQLDNHIFFQHLSPEEQEIEKAGWKHPCEFCGLRFKIQSTLYTHITIQHTKEKHYQCTICRKEFNRQGTLTRHLRTHSEDPAILKPFSCSQCQKSFTSKGGLKSHLFLHLPPEEQEIEKESWNHSCGFCGARYPFESLLNIHIIGVHTNEKHFPCPKCKKEFKHQGHLTTHLRTHSEDPAIRKPFSCSQCQKTFTNKSHLTHHEKTVHLGLKEFPCPQCHKCFSQKSKLNSHLFLHLPPEEQEIEMMSWKHPCNFCGAQFKIQSSLHWHITSVHTKEKHYQCTICRKEFNQQGHLNTHLRTHSTDPSTRKPFSCHQCHKTFTLKSDLARHEKTVHQGIKQFPCSQCHKCFASKSQLNSHLFLHLPPEEQEIEMMSWKHPCNFCGARFKIESSLHWHITSVHTKEKHYQCTICRKEFNHQGNLTTHLRTHNTDPVTRKPFSCSQCQKSFTHKSHLTRHEKTVHLGLKDFTCPQCHKLFSTKSHLTTHLSSVHAKIRHSCSHCSKTFSTKSDARSHERKTH